jgi:hypothetical protein
MKIEQIYTGCLAEAAYYIESDGEAAIIDPLREVEPYLKRAAKDGANIYLRPTSTLILFQVTLTSQRNLGQRLFTAQPL